VSAFDLETYLARIGRAERGSGSRVYGSAFSDPDMTTVAALMRAHMEAIPFENLDVLLGRGVRPDLEGVFAKLVTARRGGYCFEHATLFEAALRTLGFEPVAHAARVLLVAPKPEAPRTHMFLTVVLDGVTCVLDPGFGGHGPLVPLPLADGHEVVHERDRHRLVRRDGEWVLEAQLGRAMTPLWTSSLEPQYAIDFVVANHYVSTFPGSRFVDNLLVRALTPGGRVSAMNRDVTVLENGVVSRRQLTDRRELRALLVAHYGFDLPEVESLRVPAVPEWN
jgi:N-hydroxyarylamine O-acetyltransferase